MLVRRRAPQVKRPSTQGKPAIEVRRCEAKRKRRSEQRTLSFSRLLRHTGGGGSWGGRAAINSYSRKEREEAGRLDGLGWGTAMPL
jgi:hypothetical protein